MPATKAYTRVNFENYPSTNTPLNATNLNKVDKGIDDLDDLLVTARNNIETLQSNATTDEANILAIQGSVGNIESNLNGFAFYPAGGVDLVALVADDSFYTDANDKYVLADSDTGQALIDGVTYKALASTEDCRGEVGADSVAPFSKKKDLSIAVDGTYANNWNNRTIYTNNSGKTETLVINRHKDNSNSFTGAYVYVDGNRVAQHQLHYVGKVTLDNGKSITMTTENSATGVYNIVKMVDA